MFSGGTGRFIGIDHVPIALMTQQNRSEEMSRLDVHACITSSAAARCETKKMQNVRLSQETYEWKN